MSGSPIVAIATRSSERPRAMEPGKPHIGSDASGAKAEGGSFDHPAISDPGTQPAARLIVSPALPEFLARSLAIIQYRAENLRILSVFGLAALSVKLRVGHIDVTVNDVAWHWADASGEQIKR